MDPVTNSLITTLNLDARVGVPPDAKRSYTMLKSVLGQKFGVESELMAALDNLEKKPDSEGRQQVLREEISVVQADSDPDILAAARRLLEQLSLQQGQILGMEFEPDAGSAVDQAGTKAPPSKPSKPSLTLSLPRPHRAEYFTGRQTELAQIQDCLCAEQNVLIYGPDGAGKSAVAAEAIWQLANSGNLFDRFPSGVFYHSFYQQPQVTLALEHMIHAFKEDLWPTPLKAAERTLARHKALLVLDQVEYADDLPLLLSVCHHSTLLFISNQPLEGVQAYHLETSPLAEMVKLLQIRAGNAKMNQEVARQICDLLGRLPLAIELAAAYISAQALSGVDYLNWLNQTPLASLDQPQRQVESIPLLIECSLARLSDEARRALAVVGLLAPVAFGLEVVAEALTMPTQQSFLTTIRELFSQKTSSETSAEEDWITTEYLALDELSRYGLLRRLESRFEVSHPLVHGYVRQNVLPSSEVTDRLVTYYSRLVGKQILLGLDGYVKLDAERPHIMRILAACVEQEKWAAASSLAAAIEDYLDLQNHRTDRVTTNQIGLLATRQLGRRHNEAAWLGNLGLAYNDLGQPEEAIQYYQQALDLARQTGDQRTVGNNLGKLGLAYRDLGQIGLARQSLKQALAIFEQINSPSADMVQDWLAEFEPE